MSSDGIHGVVVYHSTPFDESDGVDTLSLRALVERVIASGVYAIAPLGNTCDGAYRDDGDGCTVAELCIDAVSGRVRTAVEISDVAATNALRRNVFAAEVSSDTVTVLPVACWNITGRELLQC
jgi:dihydrodipicolinate synthase/N-acetylneuraminate lyase